MKFSLAVQKLFLLALMVVCGLGIWQAQLGYRADLLYEQSRVLQQAWIDEPSVLEESNWLTAGQNLEAALSLGTAEAEYLHQYGLLITMEHNLLGESTTVEDIQRIYPNAIEMHRRGLQQRPASPFGWTYFALTKAIAGQLDSEFELALERANTLGPWEKGNHQLVAYIAENYWSSMSNTGRYYTAVQLQRALSTPGFDQPTIGYFTNRDFLPNQLCPVLDQSNLTEPSRAACQLD